VVAKVKKFFLGWAGFLRIFQGGWGCLSGIFRFAASGSRSPEGGIGVIKWGWEADSR